MVKAAVESAARHGTVVSYDLNYRPSLWKGIGGKAQAQAVNRSLAPLVDVMLGNEEDFSAALGFAAGEAEPDLSVLDPRAYGQMMAKVVEAYPNLALIATTLRVARTASRNDWGGACFAGGRLTVASPRPDLEILDRVGGGDSFASGLIYGILAGLALPVALEYGVAHGALAMTTPGDTSMATLAEVEALVAGGSARVVR